LFADSDSGRTSAQESGSDDNTYQLSKQQDEVPPGSIFIGDISKEVSEDDLKDMFTAFGEVIDVVIKRSRTTNQSLGYGFVTMKNAELARSCLEQKGDIVLKGRKLRIGKAQRNTKLFIGNINPSVAVYDLNAAFSVYGMLVEEDTVINVGGELWSYCHYHQ
jgi:RNA recognition motif-containing protein